MPRRYLFSPPYVVVYEHTSRHAHIILNDGWRYFRWNIVLHPYHWRKSRMRAREPSLVWRMKAGIRCSDKAGCRGASRQHRRALIHLGRIAEWRAKWRRHAWLFARFKHIRMVVERKA